MIMRPLLLPAQNRVPSGAALAYADAAEEWGRSVLCSRQEGEHGRRRGRGCEWRESGKGPDVPWGVQGGKRTYKLLPASHCSSMDSRKHCPPALAFEGRPPTP